MTSELFNSPLSFFINILCLLIVVTIHEFAHAITADKLGDPTPRLQGRVSFNPRVHLDPMGSLFLLLVGFGWGKPVQFDPYNLKDPRKDAAIISLAGPLSNFLLALVLAIVLRLITSFPFLHSSVIGYMVFIIFIPRLILYNILLGVFNLIPIHPLDGFKIVGGMLPEDKAHEWYQLERYGYIFLLLLIIPLGAGGSMIIGILDPIIRSIVTVLLPPI